MKWIKNWAESYSGHSELVTVADTASEATYKVLKKLLNRRETPSRNGMTREFSHHTIKITGNNPYTLLPRRKNNVFATIAETLWVMSGSNDISRLTEKWLPRASEYSDDWDDVHKSGTWRAGYGPRIRKYPKAGGDFVDQVELCITRLRVDPYTRQSVITISNPAVDSIGGSKDYPCNMSLTFRMHGNSLDLYAYLRSNDMIFGFCINVYEWVFLQRYIADSLGLNVGNYYHTASSMHIYQSHYKRAQEIVDNYIRVPNFKSFTKFDSITPSQLTRICDQIYNCNQLGDLNMIKYYPVPLKDCYYALRAEKGLELDLRDDFLHGGVYNIVDSNLRLAVLDLGQRRLKTCLADKIDVREWLDPAIAYETKIYLSKSWSKHLSAG